MEGRGRSCACRVQVGVVQFSNDVRVEFTPGEGDDEAFQKALKSMVGGSGGEDGDDKTLQQPK